MKPRLNIYIDYPLVKQLEQAAARGGSSKSGLVEAALVSFFSPDGGDRREAALARRLDRLTRQFGTLERNQKAILETLALFIRHSLTVTAPLPAAEQAAALLKGEERFARFIEQAGRELAAAKSPIRDMVDEVLPRAEDFFSSDELETSHD